MRWLVVLGLLSGCDLVFGLNDPAIADAPIDQSTTCEADLGSDPQNCGACGHDCFGGSCSTGVCQPLELVRDISPLHIAQTSTHLYWTDAVTGTIQRVLKSGTSMDIETMIQGQMGTLDIAVDDVHFYWTAGDKILRCSHAGCQGQPDQVGMCGSPTVNLVAGTTNIHITCGTSFVVRVAKATAGATDVVGDGMEIRQIAVSGTRVYWAEKAGNRIRTAPEDASGPPGSFVDVESVESIAADETNVYAGGEDTSVITSITRSGGVAKPLVAGQLLVTGIAAHGGLAYWIGGGDAGYLRSCAGNGCDGMPTTLASELLTPVDLVVDDRFYFIATLVGPGAGTILRLAR